MQTQRKYNKASHISTLAPVNCSHNTATQTENRSKSTNNDDKAETTTSTICLYFV